MTSHAAGVEAGWRSGTRLHCAAKPHERKPRFLEAGLLATCKRVRPIRRGQQSFGHEFLPREAGGFGPPPGTLRRRTCRSTR